MPTTKERLLITLTPSMARKIKAIAKREKTPKATIVARYLEAMLAGVPTVQLSPEGERRALRAIATSRKAECEGKLKILHSLADLIDD